MPRYVARIKVFADESEMASESADYTDEESFKAHVITYFEDGGNGPLAGLSESVPDGSEANGDYAVWINEVSRPAE